MRTSPATGVERELIGLVSMKTPMALPGGSGYSPRLISLVSSELWAPVELPIPQSASQRGGRDSGMIMRVLTAVVFMPPSGLRGRMAARPVPRIR